MVVVKVKLRTYLDFVRLPNVITAIADILAGFLFNGGSFDDWPTLSLLCAASALLYGGGVALNDVCDVARDHRERPHRPIPSGRISYNQALMLSLVLLGGGVALALVSSVRSGAVAILLVVVIVLYDAVLKAMPIAPALMGMCRALNLMLGVSGAGGSLWPLSVLVAVGLMWLYVTSVTVFGRNEAGINTRSRLQLATIGIGAAVGGLASLVWLIHQAYPAYLGLVALLAVVLGYRGWSAAGSADPAEVQGAVKLFVISLIAFDACLVWAVCGWSGAIIIGALWLPASLLGRWLRVT